MLLVKYKEAQVGLGEYKEAVLNNSQSWFASGNSCGSLQLTVQSNEPGPNLNIGDLKPPSESRADPGTLIYSIDFKVLCGS